MKKTRRFLAIMLAAVMAFAMVPAQAQAAGEEIPIGAVLPLTGSSTGEFLKAAMEVAEDIVNNSHDLDWDLAKNEGILDGQKIKISFADHQASADLATTEAAKLLDDGVVAITGAYNSGCSASVATQALEYGIPMVCGSSSSASLTDGSTYAFKSIFNRVAANDEQESQEFFAYLQYLNDTYDAGIK
ncbi:MAG: ABC transporter substrate-binding protein [Firmicutes bacterium]|nr:ABC transporter substrate-binding protein [Bacillota bacterium]